MTSDFQPSLQLARLQSTIEPLRVRLAEHPLYQRIQTVADLRLFMASHVFAVWDFMSLLKALQARLTCVSSPWRPTALPESRRFINEIVLGEESDLFEGKATSHFELYLRAMHEAGAETSPIHTLLSELDQTPILQAIDMAPIPQGARHFLHSTFDVIGQGRLHALAATFTFGREDVIPAMFRALVRDLNRQNDGAFAIFLWYLERHIEVDGEDHGPLSLRMVEDLCGSSVERWQEATEAAAQALQARLHLWDAILASLAPA